MEEETSDERRGNREDDGEGEKQAEKEIGRDGEEKEKVEEREG